MGGRVVQGMNILSIYCISQQVIDALVEKGEIFTCSGGVVALGLEYLVPPPVSVGFSCLHFDSPDLCL